MKLTVDSVSKLYRARNNECVRIMNNGGKEPFIYSGENGVCYTEHGLADSRTYNSPDSRDDLVSLWSDDDQYKADDNKTCEEREDEHMRRRAQELAIQVNNGIMAAESICREIPRRFLCSDSWVAVKHAKALKEIKIMPRIIKRMITLIETGYKVTVEQQKVEIGCVKDIPLKVLRAALCALTSESQPSYTWNASGTTLPGGSKETKARAYRTGIKWAGHRITWADADQLLQFLNECQDQDKGGWEEI